MFLHKSVIRGHHINKCVRSPTLGEIESIDREHGNTHDTHDCHTLCQLKGGSIIGIALSSTFFMTCLRRRHGSHHVTPRLFTIT